MTPVCGECESKIFCPVQRSNERALWRSATESETSRSRVASQKVGRADQVH